jgi:hypothetical protein
LFLNYIKYLSKRKLIFKANKKSPKGQKNKRGELPIIKIK